jgi:cytochrome oxidase Cu insertion factor (SCO1/SenC/PrrC family)/ABC-type branched-subunit amino acid transport system substrate-binding protein
LPAAAGPQDRHGAPGARPVQQQQQHQHGAPAATETVELGDMTVPDVELIDQDGRPVRFYTDLVAGKVVAINFIFTTCTTICPPMGANFGRLQRALGDRMGAEVSLISVSVDPLVDTPPRLKAWGAQFGAGPGWTLVTGAKSQVDDLLKALGVFTPDKLDHSPTLLVGNDRTGRWTRAHGLAAPDTLAELIVSMLEPGGLTPAGALLARASLAVQARLDAQQRWGRQLYASGATAAGEPIVAVMGEGDVEVPATVLPCASCHGHDGRGNPEGGVTPADVTWDALTKPYGTTRSDGRRRPPYDRELLMRAIREGVDSGGAPLDPTMPRYRMSDASLAELVSYLEVIGTISDPGIGETTLTIGVILPPGDEPDGMGAAVRAVLRAYFSEVNRRGGLYGRQIEIEFALPPAATADPARRVAADPARRVAAVAAFVEAAQPFAIGTAFVAGADAEIGALAGELQLPVVGAIGLYPDIGFPLNRYVFHLYAGMVEQGQALTAFAAARFPAESRNAAIIHAGDERARQVADAVATRLERDGIGGVERRELDEPAAPGAPPAGRSVAELAAELRDAGIESVFFAGGDAAPAIELLEAGAGSGWEPLLFMAGSSAGADIFAAPVSADGRIFLSFPAFPTDRTEEAMLEYRSLLEAYALPPSYQSMQLTALASARLLLEGLARSGRDLSREKLVTALEGVYSFETGLMPPISYGPNRRIGALGAYVVGVDLRAGRLGPTVEWVPLR